MDQYRRNGHGQGGEDGVVDEIFRRLAIETGWFADIGAADGEWLSNTMALAKKGWSGVWVESDEKRYRGLEYSVKKFALKGVPIKMLVSCEPGEDLDSIFRGTPLPEDFDLLSIDIDGNDYWIWKGLQGYKPKVVIIEYNPQCEPNESKVIEYDRLFQWGGDAYYGASAGALLDLAAKKGYTMVYHTPSLSLFFVRNEFAERFEPWPLEKVKQGWFHAPHPKGPTHMVDPQGR